MFLSRVSGPSSQPITTAEAKIHGIVNHDDDDSYISGLIDVAARSVGEYAGRVLNEETWAWSVPAVTRGDLILPKSPVKSVSSITYYDAEDSEQSATVGDFYLMKGDDRAVLRPKSGNSWPTANTDRDDAITITFVAGYTTIPDNLLHAVKMMVAHLYENRSAVEKDQMHPVPLGVEAMINQERLGWVQS